MKIQIILALFALLTLSLMSQGCAPSASGKVYTRDQARQEMQVSYGSVLQVSTVTIEGTQSGLGTIAGGALGAGVGQAVGSGTGRTLSTIAGGVVGAVAGSATEKGVTTKGGLEIMVRLDNGETISVVQESDVVFRAGDRVRVLRGGGTTRVSY